MSWWLLVLVAGVAFLAGRTYQHWRMTRNTDELDLKFQDDLRRLQIVGGDHDLA